MEWEGSQNEREIQKSNIERKTIGKKEEDLQREETCFTVFFFFPSFPSFPGTFLLTYTSVLSQNALLNSTESDEIMHHSVVVNCSIQ